MSSHQAGAPATLYEVYIDNPLGERIADITKQYISLDGAVALGTVGAVELILPVDLDPLFLADDNIIEIWRTPRGGAPYLFLDRLWWMRDFKYTGNRGAEQTRVICHDQNFLFSDPGGQIGRIVAYDDEPPYTDKVDSVDDMMKAYVRENAGSLATDTDRDLSTYLSVAVDVGLGPTAHSNGTSRRNLMSVLNDLSAMAANLGTYVAWDIVCSTPPHPTLTGARFALQFRTYIGQRGDDHRSTSTDPVLIGPDFGNLDNWELSRLTSGEATYVYGKGEGIGTVAAISPAFNQTRIDISPFNRREYLVDSDAEDAAGLADDAEAGLRSNRLRETLVGTILETDGLMFDVHYGFGDYLTAQVQGKAFDCRLDAIRFKFDRNNQEKLTAVLRQDDIT